MSVFTRAAFSALFLAAFFSLPAVLAEREAETGKKARPQVAVSYTHLRAHATLR